MSDDTVFPAYEFEVIENLGIKASGDGGMTKRELFAAIAFINRKTMVVVDPTHSDEEQLKTIARGQAKVAVIYADALLAELNKDGGSDE